MARSSHSGEDDPAAIAAVSAASERKDGELHTAPPSDPEVFARLERGLVRLPRWTREIFLAHRLDGLTYAEIAAISGLSRRRVQQHMAKAIGRLARFADGDERPGWKRWVQSRLPCWFR